MRRRLKLPSGCLLTVFATTTFGCSAASSEHWNIHVELFDLANDSGEQHDLSAKSQSNVNYFRERLHQWRETIHAAMPSPNPDSKPEPVPRKQKQ